MKMVALLRGINVGGNRKVPMADLRLLAAKLGFSKVETYIQSGNLIFDAGQASTEKVQDQLETAIEKKFGFFVDVMVSNARQWKSYVTGNPFVPAAKSRPNLVLLGLSKEPCARDLADKLSDRVIHGEEIKVVGEIFWIDFIASVGQSKITPAVLEKAAGSPVTMRNWTTVLQLQQMLD